MSPSGDDGGPPACPRRGRPAVDVGIDGYRGARLPAQGTARRRRHRRGTDDAGDTARIMSPADGTLSVGYHRSPTASRWPASEQ